MMFCDSLSRTCASMCVKVACFLNWYFPVVATCDCDSDCYGKPSSRALYRTVHSDEAIGQLSVVERGEEPKEAAQTIQSDDAVHQSVLGDSLLVNDPSNKDSTSFSSFASLPVSSPPTSSASQKYLRPLQLPSEFALSPEPVQQPLPPPTLPSWSVSCYCRCCDGKGSHFIQYIEEESEYSSAKM